MNSREIYKDIAARTGGDIYIGVVGPVRSGKSTFIKRFMETAVIPNIKGEYEKKRASDELPQSADGKTVMTAEPKFVPDEAVTVTFSEGSNIKMRMVDCVGYIIPGVLGTTEEGVDRMIKTPWSDEPMSFEAAAEQGTLKVMRDHSTVGIIVTSDGTIGEIDRESYVEAEERIVNELKEIGKPFVLVLNSSRPDSSASEELALKLEKKYSCPVALLNCLELDTDDIEGIIEMLLYEFPVAEIDVSLPQWLSALPDSHELSDTVLKCIRSAAYNIKHLSDMRKFVSSLEAELKDSISNLPSEYTVPVSVKSSDLSSGIASVEIKLPESIYYNIINDLTGLSISGRGELITALMELSKIRREYEKYSEAMAQLEERGYGIVMPKISDLELCEPEVIKSSGSYGVKIRATADSIHMIKANIETEINPIVGTQDQAEEIIQRLVNEYEEEPAKIWESNIFGKSLYELVNDGLDAKINHLSEESREKLSETLSRIINESSNGLICILL
ncbi:MAG: stage IV sporulation protein A [Clostridia bacterium]|nr:stage IV sporulation protein A [Clostridia bacterium]